MSHWASIRSFGCFVYFDGEHDVPARSLLETLVSGLRLPADTKISTKNYVLRWRKLDWKAIDAAVADSTTLSVTLLVGSPQDVRLGGSVRIRNDPAFKEDSQVPRFAWVGAESERWPEQTFSQMAREWLRVAATLGGPLSGGVLAARDLRAGKIEMTNEFESDQGEEPDRSPKSFWGRMMAERPMQETRTKIRRIYPTTLLGPRFARQLDAEKLGPAGATNIEQINGSIIFDATPQLLEAWSPEYLAATVELRRLLWPLTFQNPADDPDPRRKSRP